MPIRRLVLVLTVAFTAACAGTPGPGDSGYPFNVGGSYNGSISADGQGFSGGMELETAGGGLVTGTFRITQPVQIEGQVEGTLIGDQLALSIEYGQNAATGCSAGTASGTVTVSEGGGMIRGTLMIDDCGTVLGGQMTFRR